MRKLFCAWQDVEPRCATAYEQAAAELRCLLMEHYTITEELVTAAELRFLFKRWQRGTPSIPPQNWYLLLTEKMRKRLITTSPILPPKPTPTNEMKQKPKMIAWCYASGELVFSATEPEGTLPVLRHLAGSKHYRRTLGVFCRLAYDNKTLLVPGLPEDPASTEALTRFEVHCSYYIRKAESAEPTPGFTLPEPTHAAR
ncbi:MAG: hypothetical protein IJB33_08430 [Akkermansia sp.]|nr:hypothetical protein [Akkermansia sp.]